MKLEYNVRNHLYLIFLAPILILLKFSELKRKGDANLYNYNVVAISIIVFVLIFVFLYFYKMYVIKKYKKYGTKVQGYIIDSYVYRWGKNRNFILKFWYNNQIYTIDRLRNNKAYKFIENDLESLNQVYTDPSQIKKYPIDIYLYNGKYSADVESVRFDI